MKRYALLLTLIFVCSLAPIKLGTFDEPDSLSGSQEEIEASLASGRNNNPPTIDSIVLHNTEALYVGQTDPINMTVEASDFEDPTGDSLNYTWSNAGDELPGCGGSGNDGANCLLPILSTYLIAFPVSVTVTDSEGASVSGELMLTIWNNVDATAASESGISVSYSIKYFGTTPFFITATDIGLSSYENIELPDYSGTYSAVSAISYAPSTTYSANDVLQHSLNVSVAKSLGATSLWYVTDAGQWTMLSSNANEVDASTEQFSFAFPENSPVLSAGTLVLIGDSMSPIAPPDATISGLTAYQSSDYGDITSSWEVSGTYLSSDVIQVTICQDNLNCENAFSTTLAIGDFNFVFSGSSTSNGSMYYITVEICNEEDICSIPGQASVLVEKSSDSDTDGDGVNDGDDRFPNDANESVDSDGDGVGDNSDAFPQDGNETHDDDGDGVGDNSDAFPQDGNETHDDDGDGVGNNSDAFPQDGNETHDDDGDGVGNNSDAFPQDENETMDTDADGVGDNEDPEPENPDVSSPQDISVEISDSSSYIIAGSIVFLAIVILFVRRKQPPQPQINSHFVTDDSMWNED
ncbi:hypothetical protein OAT73_05535 [Candidatus Poseidoniaceae archaeon]|nr:hypothetical protein [Candidatus Poseidoniaceae archaeon]